VFGEKVTKNNEDYIILSNQRNTGKNLLSAIDTELIKIVSLDGKIK